MQRAVGGTSDVVLVSYKKAHGWSGIIDGCSVFGWGFVMDMDSEQYRSAFEAVFSEYYGVVCRYFARRVSGDVVEDLVEEVFLVTWRKFDQVDGEVLPWLYGVAGNVLANYRRGVQRQGALVDRVGAEPVVVGGDLGDVLAGCELSPELRGVLLELALPEREAIVLVWVEGLKPKEAAVVVGCSALAFRARLSRARRKVVALVGERGLDVGAGFVSAATLEEIS